MTIIITIIIINLLLLLWYILYIVYYSPQFPEVYSCLFGPTIRNPVCRVHSACMQRQAATPPVRSRAHILPEGGPRV